MRCPTCNNNASYYKAQNAWFCHVCNTWVETPIPDAPAGSAPEPFKASWETANMAAGLGFANGLIGLLLIFLYWDIITFWPVVAYFMLGWGCLLPCCGATLILLKRYKLGAYIQIAGSALLVPVGLIGIYGGRIALALPEHRKR